MDRSKAFYRDVIRILQDHGDFVQFDGGFALHDGSALHGTAFGLPPEVREPYARRNLVLYFDSGDLVAAFGRIAPHAAIIQPIERQAWRPRVFRFFDPDGHIVDVGEPL